jgi:hypothetical protein
MHYFLMTLMTCVEFKIYYYLSVQSLYILEASHIIFQQKALTIQLQNRNNRC